MRFAEGARPRLLLVVWALLIGTPCTAGDTGPCSNSLAIRTQIRQCGKKNQAFAQCMLADASPMADRLCTCVNAHAADPDDNVGAGAPAPTPLGKECGFLGPDCAEFAFAWCRDVTTVEVQDSMAEVSGHREPEHSGRHTMTTARQPAAPFCQF